jgi:hypothetical protein
MMLNWQRYREGDHEVQRGLFLGEPLYLISRAADGRWHVYFRGESLAHSKHIRRGQHAGQIRRLKEVAEAHFGRTFVPKLLAVLRST